jgi:hypothetical protein
LDRPGSAPGANENAAHPETIGVVVADALAQPGAGRTTNATFQTSIEGRLDTGGSQQPEEQRATQRLDPGGWLTREKLTR